jgi:toxin ParE1/3/4
MTRLRVTTHAKRDLDQIWLYIACDNVEAATNLIQQITSRFHLLKSSPTIGRPRDELIAGMRSHPVGQYIIYYRRTHNAVRILRVLHAARDPRRVFQP